MKRPYETFDIDLLEGIAREEAFARVLCHATFEHKRDHEAITSGRVAIEFEERRGEQQQRPSGIAITTADWWVIEFREDCRLVLPTREVKRLARLAIKANMHAWIGDGKNHHNAFVPFEWFLKSPLSEVSE